MGLEHVAKFDLLDKSAHPICVRTSNGAIAVGDGLRILVFEKVDNFSSPRVIEVREEFRRVWKLCFSGDGSALMAGMLDGSLVSYQYTSGEEIEVLTKYNHRVTCISVSHDAQIVVSGSHDKTVKVCGGVGWSIEAKKAHRAVGLEHTDDVMGIALLKGEETFVSGSQDYTLRVWDLECNCLKMVGTDMILSLALSPCKSQVAVGHIERGVCLFETETWENVWEYEVHADVWSLSFHGRYIATSSSKGTDIIDIEGKKVIKRLKNEHYDPVSYVSFTPCGTSLLITSWHGDKTLVKWPLFPKETRALASFFDASGIETLLYEEGGFWDFEEARSEVFKLASQEIIPRIKRVLHLEMGEGVVTC